MQDLSLKSNRSLYQNDRKEYRQHVNILNEMANPLLTKQNGNFEHFQNEFTKSPGNSSHPSRQLLI
jgi:hypothetical protein